MTSESKSNPEQHKVFYGTPATPDEIYNINQKILKAYVLGWVEYADDLGNLRRTAFCRLWDPSFNRFRGFTEKDPDYEYSD